MYPFRRGSRPWSEGGRTARLSKENYTVKLQINEGPIDRGIRIVVGIALLAAAAAGLLAAPIVYVTSFVGAIALVTGIVGFCPLYAILRLSTVSARR